MNQSKTATDFADTPVAEINTILRLTKCPGAVTNDLCQSVQFAANYFHPLLSVVQDPIPMIGFEE
jgi:hypothetical protein